MKVILPEHIGEITLGQFQQYHEISDNEVDYSHKKKVISIFCNVDENLIDQFPSKDIESFYDQIMKALKQDSEFQQTFNFNGIEFGFHPNLDQMKGAEWGDLMNYHNDIKNYHRVMAILYRPILEKDSFGNYKLIDYNGTSEYAETMKQFPLNIVNGVMVFFYNLAKELEAYILKFTNKAQQKEQTLLNTLNVGGGMQPLSV